MKSLMMKYEERRYVALYKKEIFLIHYLEQIQKNYEICEIKLKLDYTLRQPIERGAGITPNCPLLPT